MSYIPFVFKVNAYMYRTLKLSSAKGYSRLGHSHNMGYAGIILYHAIQVTILFYAISYFFSIFIININISANVLKRNTFNH